MAWDALPPSKLSTDDMTRECLEKREMVFYMFFMCFNTAEKRRRNCKEDGKEKYKETARENYGMRYSVFFFPSSPAARVFFSARGG